MHKQIAEGRQVYIVYPLIKESEKIDLKNLEEGYLHVCEEFPECRVCKVHGKMKPAEKDAQMQLFVSGEAQIMVATTVIEVGVNVPNASVMVIENAERFGLSQLHQLRGRVGRGEHQSYCIFIQGNNEENTSKRLKILNESNDGFYIAGEDLKLRGPGDLFGIRQSGLMEFKIGDIYNDAGILKNASEAAGEILALDFDLILPQHKALKEHLKGYMSEELENLDEILENWRGSDVDVQVLFLDANDAVLIKRYKETRRVHPLAGAGRLENGIEKEREKLAFLKNEADYIIDTSMLLTRELRKELEKIFLQDARYKNMYVTVLSFGFKYGVPEDADLVFDVRFLPNPYYDEHLRPLTGQVQAVRDYVMRGTTAEIFLKKLYDMIDFLLPNYINEGKNQLVIAVGCTGGKHRSVTIARALYEHLEAVGEYGIRIDHRDIEKDNKKA